MTAEQESLQAEKLPTVSCVELIPPQPQMTEYWTKDRIWILPLHRLDHAFLEQEPATEMKGPPTHKLTITYLTARVVLKGRRLDLVLEALSAGRIARAKAGDTKFAGLLRDEPWVSEITVEDLTEDFTPPMQPGTALTEGSTQSLAPFSTTSHET